MTSQTQTAVTVTDLDGVRTTTLFSDRDDAEAFAFQIFDAMDTSDARETLVEIDDLDDLEISRRAWRQSFADWHAAPAGPAAFKAYARYIAAEQRWAEAARAARLPMFEFVGSDETWAAVMGS